MPADRIEREIDIDAPIDVVWTVITQPEHITGWFTDSAELDLRPGGEGWDYPDGDEPTETNAPLVEFSLEARGHSTRLRLVESGLEKIARSKEDKETYFAEHTSGWTRIAERLRDYAPKQRSIVAG